MSPSTETDNAETSRVEQFTRIDRADDTMPGTKAKAFFRSAQDETAATTRLQQFTKIERGRES